MNEFNLTNILRYCLLQFITILFHVVTADAWKENRKNERIMAVRKNKSLRTHRFNVL